jgi:cytoskeletal protein CcmA (bactofilin family)
MFNQKSKSETAGEVSAPGTGAATIIAAGTTLKGDISNIQCQAKVVIGSNGSVEGDISGQQADIMGKVTGTIKVKELLQLKGGSFVNGNLYAGKLQIEPSANFNGQCHMTTASNGLVNEVVADKKAKELQKA